MSNPKLPPNMQEFNEITAVIFGQLYDAFPVPQNVDIDQIAKVLGLADRQQQMSSGRPFNEVFVHTLGWLLREGFVRSEGNIAQERVVLATKAMTVMNIAPPSLSQPLGSQLADAAKDGSSEHAKSKMAELMGEFFGSLLGSLTKHMSGG
jgi:hypothetical protein